MKKRKKIVIVTLLVAFGLIAIGTGLDLEDEKTKEKTQTRYALKSLDQIAFCIDKENCPLLGGNSVYAYMSYETENEELKDVFSSINEETKNYYELSKNSTLEDTACQEAKKYFQHSIKVDTQYYQYTDDNFVSVATKRNIVNLCTREVTSLQATAYFYDKGEKKIVTQQAFLRKIGINEEQINQKIEENIQEENEINLTNYTLENTYQNGKQDIILFYESNGDLYASYKQYEDNTYHLALIQKK